MRNRHRESYTLYHTRDIVEERDVVVGVIITPDQTDPSGFFLPVTFPKKIAFLRNMSIYGKIHIEGEEVYDSSTYSHGLEPFNLVMRMHNKLKTGVATVTAEVTLSPIIILPQDEPKSWETPRTEYIYAPADWLDVSTPAGEAALKAELHLRQLPWEERLEAQSCEKRIKRMCNYSLQAKTERTILYSSDNSQEENYGNLIKFLDAHNQPYEEKVVKKLFA